MTRVTCLCDVRPTIDDHSRVRIALLIVGGRAMRLDEVRKNIFFNQSLLARDLFTGISDADREKLESITRRTVIEKDKFVFREGERPRFVYELCSGQARLSHLSAAVQVSNCTVDSGRLFGLIETLADCQFSTTLETLSSCRIGLIPRDDVLVFLMRYPDICLRSVRAISEHFQRLVTQHRSN